MNDTTHDRELEKLELERKIADLVQEQIECFQLKTNLDIKSISVDLVSHCDIGKQPYNIVDSVCIEVS